MFNIPMHNQEMTEAAAAHEKSLEQLTEQLTSCNVFDPEDFQRYHVKRGLRNSDGTGVLAGLTNVCNVHGYVLDEGEKSPIDGQLVYRGVDVTELVRGCIAENRFGYEECVWLLLFGSLPTRAQLDSLRDVLAYYRELPEGFIEDMILRAPCKDIMNKLASSVLALYAYDENPDDTSIKNVLRQSLQLIARMPQIMVASYQVKRRYFDHKSMYVHSPKQEHSMAETILRTMRSNKSFEEEEAHLLDLCLVLHAEHGGGNNSTFVTRAVSSSGSDTYSAIAAGIGALKGPKHGGANLKVIEMLHAIEEGVDNWEDDSQVKDFLYKLVSKEAGDRSGLIYGMGHAVYTKSDPRAVILKENAMKLAGRKGYEAQFRLLDAVERLTPEILAERKGGDKLICANVDLYSGLVYEMLGIPVELNTPIFAVARMAGWCAHRIEEIATGGRIMRPAYKAMSSPKAYVPLSER
nr:citrate/2-methylcitrate synthase [Maliibacterium massiliense]